MAGGLDGVALDGQRHVPQLPVFFTSKTVLPSLENIIWLVASAATSWPKCRAPCTHYIK